MDFDEIIRRRRSVRNFSTKKASWKQVLEAIDSALKGPFAGNQNNLNFLIVENEDKIIKIAEACEQDWISTCGILVLVCSDEMNLENMYGERGRVYSRQQAGAAIQTFILKLTDMGLESCWVGAYSDDHIRSKLNIPKNIQIEAIVPIGYSKEPAKLVNKKSLENVLFWEEWGKSKRPTIFTENKEDIMAG